MGSMTPREAAEKFVDAVIVKRTADRTFDGRPDRVWRNAMIDDVTALIESIVPKPAPKRPTKAAKDDRAQPDAGS